MVMKTTRIGKNEISYDLIQTRGVLGGAYVNIDRACLTHLVFLKAGPEYNSDIRTGCRQNVDNMVDECCAPARHGERPTCPTCAKVWDRLQ